MQLFLRMPSLVSTNLVLKYSKQQQSLSNHLTLHHQRCMRLT